MVQRPPCPKSIPPHQRSLLHEIVWKDVPLAAIKFLNHDATDQPIPFIPLEDYTLRCIDGELTPEAYRIIAQAHPILAVQTERGKWSCLVGQRTLALARLVLRTADLVTIGVLPKMTDDQMAVLWYGDQLLSPLAFSVQSPAVTTARVLGLKIQAKQLVPRLLPRIARNKKNLAKLLGISTATVARARKKIMVSRKKNTSTSWPFPTAPDRK